MHALGRTTQNCSCAIAFFVYGHSWGWQGQRVPLGTDIFAFIEHFFYPFLPPSSFSRFQNYESIVSVFLQLELITYFHLFYRAQKIRSHREYNLYSNISPKIGFITLLCSLKKKIMFCASFLVENHNFSLSLSRKSFKNFIDFNYFSLRTKIEFKRKIVII